MSEKTRDIKSILFVFLFPHIGGGETSLLYLIEQLQKRKLLLYVVVPAQGQVFDRLKSFGIVPIVLPLPGFLVRTLFVPGASIKGIYSLYKLCQKLQPDIIHLNHPTISIYGGIVGKLLHIPVIATSHGIWDSIYWYQDLVYRLFLDTLHTITPEVSQQFLKRKIIQKQQLFEHFLGIDTTRFKSVTTRKLLRKKLGIKPRITVITMVARLDPGKNHVTFLGCANELLKQYEDILFLIVADTEHNLEQKSQMVSIVKMQLETILRTNPRLKKHIRFIPFRTNMAEIYQSSDILFSSSLSETLPMSLIEAAACKVPIVAYHTGSNHQVVIDGKNGFLIKLHTMHDLTTKTAELIDDRKLQVRFGTYGRKIVLRKFSVQEYADALIAQYKMLVKKI